MSSYHEPLVPKHATSNLYVETVDWYSFLLSTLRLYRDLVDQVLQQPGVPTRR